MSVDAANNNAKAQEIYEARKRRNNAHTLALATVCPLFDIAIEPLFNKNLRKDTFKKTIEASVENLSESSKNIFSWCSKNILRSEKLTNKIKDIKPMNKTYLAAVFVLNVAANFGFFKGLQYLFNKNK